ncbi:1-deoxy-D-xylulose-5-phosphate synthase [Streptomyces sp. NBC_01077]|uniref:1-deoxy-D-xylulose-5-phosphate synthase n=1 Tax=Streptomyces sp. NBC_01077 TaxID=2903746 RepID=UPI003869C0A0|nr:1-deoxy-D-xylulose-5-phosphate synthase [Streptomyces sp. NBC_01077]WSV44366.1 1-deoxy-D-xylulose-5-phosphate synthase [Streptomyces sp. NBC_01077]
MDCHEEASPILSAPRPSQHRPLLPTITNPRKLDAFTGQELESLAGEIRSFLVDNVAQTGGHLGPNLGAVELTIALHRVFDSPRDRILFDTGHQSYVHKILTGRQDFSRLRASGGLSGYPSRTESEHDVIENSHASTAIGYADGLAKANQLLGHHNRPVVAVVGDGALTGGMAWEALNNIAAAKERPVIVVVNDNQRSYSPTIGGLASHLAALRPARDSVDQADGCRVSGRPFPSSPHGSGGTVDLSSAPTVFEDLGLAYIGPVDGHDIAALEAALQQARDFRRPVIVHCLTEKGRGYSPAERCDEDRFHAVGAIHPDTGLPLKPSGRDWTAVFGEEMLALGREREDIVAVTAAMLHPVGLAPFAKEFPERVFDVGIAEQHAAVSAAGLATGGVHPVVAIYATFLNRAFDQLLMDIALHRLGVTFVLDRAGITGPDGASHNGMWDMSILQVVPGLRLAAPRDASQLRAQLREAAGVEDAPTVIRYPKGAVGPDVPALGRIGGMDVLRGSTAPASESSPCTQRADVLLVSVGAMASTCIEAAELLEAQGISSTVVDPRWVKPVDPALPALASEHGMVVTVEDNSRSAGVGSAVAQELHDASVDVPLRNFGIPQRFFNHAKREEVLAEIGLTAPGIARQISVCIQEARISHPLAHESTPACHHCPDTPLQTLH